MKLSEFGKAGRTDGSGAIPAGTDLPQAGPAAVLRALLRGQPGHARLYRPVLAALGLTYPQYLTLLALWEKSPRTVGALGDALDLDSGTLTPLLKRLEKQNLVRRRRDPAG